MKNSLAGKKFESKSSGVTNWLEIAQRDLEARPKKVEDLVSEGLNMMSAETLHAPLPGQAA